MHVCSNYNKLLDMREAPQIDRGGSAATRGQTERLASDFLGKYEAGSDDAQSELLADSFHRSQSPPMIEYSIIIISLYTRVEIYSRASRISKPIRSDQRAASKPLSHQINVHCDKNDAAIKTCETGKRPEPEAVTKRKVFRGSH